MTQAVLQNSYIPAAKANLEAYLQQLQGLRATTATSYEIADLYATSVFLHATVNFWADAVSGADFIVYRNGIRVEPEHPLQRLLSSNGDMYRRSEVCRLMWGRNLLWKRRTMQQRIFALKWMNPTLYRVDAGVGGLRGFSIYRGKYSPDKVRYIHPQDAIYTHEIDFMDDFDGISAAEVAFLQASAETELATTALAWFRNSLFMGGLFQPADGENKSPDNVSGLRALLKRMFQGAANAGRTLVQNARWDYIQLQQDFDKVALSSTYESIRQNVSIATNVPVEFVTTGQANYAEIKGKIQLWYQLRLMPVLGRYADAYVEQLASEYGNEYTIEPDITPLMISDPAEQAELVEKKIESIVIDLYSAQKELGVRNPDPNLIGLYRVNGIPVPSKHLRELWQYQLGSGAAIAQAQPMYDVTALASKLPPLSGLLPPGAKSQKDDGKPVFAYIPLVNHRDILVAQRYLKDLLTDERIEWQAAPTLHITLCFAEAMDDSAVERLSDQIRFEAFEVECEQGEPLGYFDTPDGKALYININLNNHLQALQANIYNAFAAAGYDLSEFSIPANYNPHLTLGTIPDDIELDVPAYTTELTWLDSVLFPVDTVIIGRDDYDPVLILKAPQHIKSKQFIPDDQYKELQDWQRIVKRKGDEYAFDARVLPEHAVEFIQWGLSLDAELDDVFASAECLLREEADERWLIDSFEAAERAAQSSAVKAIDDTRARFVKTFTPILRELDAKTLTPARAQVLVHAQLERFQRMAYLDGLVSGGIADAQMTLQDFRALSSLITKQKQFASQFINRALSEGVGDVSAKAQQWFNGSVYPFFVEGQRNGIDNPNERWDMDPALENCDSCKRLNGQVHRRSSWNEKGLYPNSNKLLCGAGNKCGCTRTVTAEKARGRFLSANYLAQKTAPLEVIKYDPNQPRDSDGQFGSGGGGSSGVSGGGDKKPPKTEKPKKPKPKKPSDSGSNEISDTKPEWATGFDRNARMDDGYLDMGNIEDNPVNGTGNMAEKQIADEHYRNLDSRQTVSVQEYTGEAYRDINKGLRSGEIPDDYADTIANMDEAMSANSLSQNTVLYRGMKMNDDLQAKIVPGATFSDAAYTSTSFDQTNANRFSGATGSAVMRIKAPAGTNGVAVSGFSEYPEEREFLLPRDTSYHITSVSRDSAGKLYIDAEIVTSTNKMKALVARLLKERKQADNPPVEEDDRSDKFNWSEGDIVFDEPETDDDDETPEGEE